MDIAIEVSIRLASAFRVATRLGDGRRRVRESGRLGREHRSGQDIKPWGDHRGEREGRLIGEDQLGRRDVGHRADGGSRGHGSGWQGDIRARSGREADNGVTGHPRRGSRRQWGPVTEHPRRDGRRQW